MLITNQILIELYLLSFVHTWITKLVVTCGELYKSQDRKIKKYIKSHFVIWYDSPFREIDSTTLNCFYSLSNSTKS